MSSITIVQLYPDELGVAGDRGNVLAITARLTEAAVPFEVIEVHVGDALPASADLVVVGGGPLSAMRGVHADLLDKAETLRSWMSDGVTFFAYGSGAELLSRGVRTVDGEMIEGVGIFPMTVTRVTTRKVGYIVAESRGERIVGFEDNASEWRADEGCTPFARVTTSSAVASGGQASVTEGLRVGASIATLLGGPLLPLNPTITAELLEAAAAHRGVQFTRGAAADLDRYAERARAVMVQHATHVFSRI